MEEDLKSARIDVLISSHNDADGLRKTVRSIVQQTYPSWRIVLVDDGSDKENQEILQVLAQGLGPRMEMVRLPINCGLTAALCLGLGKCRAPFIARIDAGDIMHPHRLRRQFDYLKGRPDVAVVGSAIEIIGRKVGFPANFRYAQLGWRPVTAHPGVLMRRDAVQEVGGYSERFPVAQDFDLWCRILRRYEIHNIEYALTERLMETSAISFARRREQITLTIRALLREFAIRRHPALLAGILHQAMLLAVPGAVRRAGWRRLRNQHNPDRAENAS